jgi:hypothetical protein
MVLQKHPRVESALTTSQGPSVPALRVGVQANTALSTRGRLRTLDTS